MDEQFEKTENSMSIYYTVNKMLIALHMALLVFFVVMRVYVMAAFCVAGVAMGGSPVFYLDNEGIHLKETTACPETVQDYAGQKKLAAFEKIEVDLKYGEFSLEEGDSYSVEYLLAGDREEPVCQVENGTLIVKEGDFGETQEGNRWYFRLWGEEGERRQDDPYVKITVPKGARLKEVSVDAPWDIDLAVNLSAEKLSVKTSYGEIKMEDWNGIDLSIYDENGDIKTGNLTGNKVEITGLKQELSEYKSVRSKLRTSDLERENAELRGKVQHYEDVIQRNNLWHFFRPRREKTAMRDDAR